MRSSLSAVPASLPVPAVVPAPAPASLPAAAALPVPAPAVRRSGLLTVAVAGDEGNWPYRERLRRDGELLLRHVRSPYEELRDRTCQVVLLRGRDEADAEHEAARLTATLGEAAPPVLVLCPTGDPRRIAAVLRLGVTSCLVEGEYDGRTLKSALRSTAGGHTHLSPSAASALARDLGHSTDRPGRAGGGGARLRLLLSPRERQVMDLMASGFKVAEIGQRMCLAVKTVRNYLSAIYTKLGVSSRTEAVLLWLGASPRPAAPHGRVSYLGEAG